MFTFDFILAKRHDFIDPFLSKEIESGHGQDQDKTPDMKSKANQALKYEKYEFQSI